MEERKTAAWVLGVIGLGIIFFTVVLPAIRFRSTQTISFQSCTVHFQFSEKYDAADIYGASQNKLGVCLCNIYKQKPDTSISNQIIKIYKKYGNHYLYDSVRLYNNIDSIMKYKDKLFDTVVQVD
jgi:hypothetical protein